MINRIKSVIILAMDGIMVTFISMMDMAKDRRKYLDN